MRRDEGSGARSQRSISKAATGIPGLDAVTGGGLPRGRPTLICGSAGCGKTLFGMEFLVRGALEHDEPGVFMAFEESADELAQNVLSLGFDVERLVARKKLLIDQVVVERSQIEETGDYDLEGLFIRLGSAIDAIGAKRVVLDTLESLFSGFTNEAILRAELRRLFRWLKDRGVTAVITAERGDGALTRNGLEEYVSDCVILLDHRVLDQIATRRLRIVKYRGTSHGTNEYPFLIDEEGIEVLPITEAGLEHTASREIVSTGVTALDEMLGGGGLYRGSTVLISGTAGTGKSSFAASLANEACRRGERCAYFAFEESSSQIIRNMRSIGIDLEKWVRAGLLRFHASRPSLLGYEAHLTRMYRAVRSFDPQLVVVDPITNIASAGSVGGASALLVRLIDFLKSRQTTTVLTSLTSGGRPTESTDIGVSSLVDTWILLRDVESDGERDRGIYLLKSRGMNHSNRVREFRLTDRGIELRVSPRRPERYAGDLSPTGALPAAKRIASAPRDDIESIRRALGRELSRKRGMPAKGSPTAKARKGARTSRTER